MRHHITHTDTHTHTHARTHTRTDTHMPAENVPLSHADNHIALSLAYPHTCTRALTVHNRIGTILVRNEMVRERRLERSLPLQQLVAAHVGPRFG